MLSFTVVPFHSSSPWQVHGLVASLECQWSSLVASTHHQIHICFWQFDSDKLCFNALPELQLFALPPLYHKSALLGDSKCKEQQDPSYLKCRAITCVHSQAPTQQLPGIQAGEQASQTCRKYTQSREACYLTLQPQKMLQIATLPPCYFQESTISDTKRGTKVLN